MVSNTHFVMFSFVVVPDYLRWINAINGLSPIDIPVTSTSPTTGYLTPTGQESGGLSQKHISTLFSINLPPPPLTPLSVSIYNSYFESVMFSIGLLCYQSYYLCSSFSFKSSCDGYLTIHCRLFLYSSPFFLFASLSASHFHVKSFLHLSSTLNFTLPPISLSLSLYDTHTRAHA